jgi:hypothetical protein
VLGTLRQYRGKTGGHINKELVGIRRTKKK